MPDYLGDDYISQSLPLNGGDTATLISLAAPNSQGAILYVHGFVDYFFHDHVARHFVARGWAWYAVDLRRCGRSLRNEDEPWYTGDLQEYYEELDRAIERIRADGHSLIVLMGHSTGGLLSVIWANDRKSQHPVDALILNSPWLDLHEPWINRTVGTWVLRGLAAVMPMTDVPKSLSGVYPQSVHASAHGDWHFNPRWKPLEPVSVKMGFFATVRREQARLHKGMDVGVPTLMLRSARSRLGLKEWEVAAQSADTVLDVDQMQQWLPAVGADVTDAPLEGALHDVLLSAEPVRNHALATIDAWLTDQIVEQNGTGTD